MTLTAALWFLLSCSDLFPADWSYAQSQWHLGLRQSTFTWTSSAEGSVLQSQATSSPWATDLLFSFPRPITRAEKPFIQLWIKIPTLPTTANANGRMQWLGFRCTEIVEGNQMIWPGVFIGTNNGVPCLRLRALTDDILNSFSFDQDAWLTLGLTWSDIGAIQLYAHEGKVQLTESDLIAEDDGTIWNGTAWETNPIYIKHMTEVHGLFLDIIYAPDETEQPVWTLAQITTHAAIVPTLDISRDGESVTLTVHGYESEQYQLQRSEDLVSWLPQPTTNDAIVNDKQFYRLISP